MNNFHDVTTNKGQDQNVNKSLALIENKIVNNVLLTYANKTRKLSLSRFQSLQLIPKIFSHKIKSSVPH